MSYIYVIYLKNRGPYKKKNITPWKAWYNKYPSAKHYKIFGYPAYVQIPKKKRNKLTNKKWKGVFGDYYKNTDRIWKIWDLVDKKVKEITFVTFDKNFSNKSSKELFNFLTNNPN